MKKSLALLLTLCLSLTLGLSTAKQVQASETAISGSVPVSTLSSPDELQELIDSNIADSRKETIVTDWKGSTPPSKVTVEKEGWLFVYTSGGLDDIIITLYSNSALTSKVGEIKITNEKTTPMLASYVGPGDYYYVISRWVGP